MGLTSSRTSLIPSFRSQSKDSLWMATRSGRGRTSSSLAKLTRSRVGTSWSGKPRSLPGGYGAHGNQARWTARQTSSVRTVMACVNHASRTPAGTGRDATPFRADGQPAGRRISPAASTDAPPDGSADANDRVVQGDLVGSAPGEIGRAHV